MVFDHRSTDKESVLILLIGCLGGCRIGRSVEDIVADELVHGSVEAIGPRTGDEIDVGSRTDCELRVRDVRLDVKLLNRVRGR